MSSLRGRTRDSSWQWLMIGLVLAIGCCGIVAVGTYAVGLWAPNIPGLALNPTAAPIVQTQVMVITTTPVPVTATTPAPANATTATGPTPFTVRPTTDSALVMPTSAQAANNTPVVGGTGVNITAATPIPLPTSAGGAANPTQASAPAITSNSADTLAQIKTTLVLLQAGQFKMGTNPNETRRALDDCRDRDTGQCKDADVEDSFPEHDVFINTFAIEKYEVSTEQYLAFLNVKGPNSHKTGCGGEPCAAVVDDQQFAHIKFDGVSYAVSNAIYNSRPVTFVTWYGAESYCAAIGRRLPTEAEWEYAARGKEGNIYPWGTFWDPKTEPTRALTSRSRPNEEFGPVDVSTYTAGATATGIFNLSGNVSEWVADWYASNAYQTTPIGQVDPKGPPSSPNNHKVVRGGDWDALPFFARTVHRRDAAPTEVRSTIGFRCASNETVLPGGNPTPLPAGGSNP
jgi:formylglycine-generating enzyme required for sulfatase activity